MRQPNRKRKISMESRELVDRDGWLGQTEEEEKPRGGAAVLSREPSVTTGETWSWEQYLRDWSAVAAPVELFSKVCGYRLRLHFDGYLSCYDFWTNAGSPDIHPVGWCEKTNHKLHIPKGYRKDKIVWMDYLKACRLQNAPKKLFRNRSSNVPVPKEFQVGMKLEAVDRRNRCLVCVATIADIMEDRIRVHFDNSDEGLDYWYDVDSPHVQPVGWCQENGRTLVAPQGYPDPENFSWTEYLEATQANTVPARVFSTRAPHGFLPNMKLEAVDKRNPRLIRVATLIDVDDHRVKDDHTDCAPKKEIEEDIRKWKDFPCSWIGKTMGSIANTPMKHSVAMIHFDGWDHKYDYWMDADSPDIHPIGWCDLTGHPLEVPYEYSAEQAQQQVFQQPTFMASTSAHPFRDLALGWEQHRKLLPGVASIQVNKVAGWTVDEVAEFVRSLLGCEEHAKCFKKEQIDGKAFLLLTQADIVKVMRIKLGPALKIYNSILMFRNSRDITEDDVAAGQESRR